MHQRDSKGFNNQDFPHNCNVSSIPTCKKILYFGHFPLTIELCYITKGQGAICYTQGSDTVDLVQYQFPTDFFIREFFWVQPNHLGFRDIHFKARVLQKKFSNSIVFIRDLLVPSWKREVSSANCVSLLVILFN